MAIRKADLSSASYRITTAVTPSDLFGEAPVTAAQLAAGIAKAKADPELGPAAAKVLQVAYRKAQERSGGLPTRADMNMEISIVLTSLKNERAAGRVNDGYVDKREAKLVAGDLAAAVFETVNAPGYKKSKPTSAADLAKRASLAKVHEAVTTLAPIIDAGFAAWISANPEDEGPAEYLRQAAKDAGLSAKGRSALMTALNAGTSRSDGAPGPSPESVKKALSSAESKLKSADGTKVVNFAYPNRTPTSTKDNFVTGVELDRKPSATGKTARAVLAFAATL